MSSLADQFLQAGFDNLVQSVQGETITVSTGASAGKTFSAVIEAKPNIEFDGVVMEDNREKALAHFSNGSYPDVAPDDQMEDSNGVTWVFVTRAINEHDNTTDFEIRKWVPGTDN